LITVHRRVRSSLAGHAGCDKRLDWLGVHLGRCLDDLDFVGILGGGVSVSEVIVSVGRMAMVFPSVSLDWFFSLVARFLVVIAIVDADSVLAAADPVTVYNENLPISS
jgi:hypothetical protein